MDPDSWRRGDECPKCEIPFCSPHRPIRPTKHNIIVFVGTPHRAFYHRDRECRSLWMFTKELSEAEAELEALTPCPLCDSPDA